MMSSFSFRPRLVDSLRGYRREDLVADCSAGLTVGVVALPLAMAFGIASGVTPQQGIITAIIAGFLISALGGSKVQIGGPAGAFVALLYGIVESYGVANLLIATMLSGIGLFAIGALRLGTLIRYIPVSIVIGFTNGIAVIILFQQLKDFLGLSIPKMPANFISQLGTIGNHLHTINPTALALAIAALVTVVAWPKSYKENDSRARRWMARVPGTILVLIAGTLIVKLGGLQVETIGSRFGGIPSGLPAPTLPDFDWNQARNLVGPVISITLLCAIESLLCARVADGITRDRHDPNQELMAQGVANFVTPMFGGIAATGTIARTVTNIRTGARSPIAGIVHSLTLLATVLVLAPLAHDVPLSVLAAILVFVAWNMGDWRAFGRLRQFTINYRAILLATFALTVIFDVTVGVEVGLLLASALFIVRVASVTRVDVLNPDGCPPNTQAYRLFGSLFFGSITKLERLTDAAQRGAGNLVLEMHQAINLDTTGLDCLEEVLRLVHERGGRLLIVAANQQPLSLMRRSGFAQNLGEENLFADLGSALASIEQNRPIA